MSTLCTQRSMEGRSGQSDGLSSRHTGLYACRGQLISTEKLETPVFDPCRRAHLNHCLVERPRMCWLGQHKEHSAAAAPEAGRPRGVAARIVTGPHEAHRQDPHLPMRYDTGRPRAMIRLRISQPRTTSLPCQVGLRARRPSPMMGLYRKNAFSTRPGRWYPDACFHRRRPSVFTHVIVRSRAGDRGPWPDTLAVLAGGTTTVGPCRLI